MGGFPGFSGRGALFLLLIVYSQCAFFPESAAEGAAAYADPQVQTFTQPAPPQYPPAVAAPPQMVPPPPYAHPMGPPPMDAYYLHGAQQVEKTEKKTRPISGVKRLVLGLLLAFYCLTVLRPIGEKVLQEQDLPKDPAEAKKMYIAYGVFFLAALVALSGLISFILTLLRRMTGV